MDPSRLSSSVGGYTNIARFYGFCQMALLALQVSLSAMAHVYLHGTCVQVWFSVPSVVMWELHVNMLAYADDIVIVMKMASASY